MKHVVDCDGPCGRDRTHGSIALFTNAVDTQITLRRVSLARMTLSTSALSISRRAANSAVNASFLLFAVAPSLPIPSSAVGPCDSLESPCAIPPPTSPRSMLVAPALRRGSWINMDRTSRSNTSSVSYARVMALVLIFL